LFSALRLRSSALAPSGHLVGEGECTPVAPLRSAGSIVTSPAMGAKAQNLPMPPKTHLALRRYATKSLVQDSLAGGGRRFLLRLSGLSPALPVSLEPVAEVLRVSACSPPEEEASDLRLSLRRSSLSSCRHARLRHGKLHTRDTVLSLPQARFPLTRDQCFKTHPQ